MVEEDSDVREPESVEELVCASDLRCCVRRTFNASKGVRGESYL